MNALARASCMLSLGAVIALGACATPATEILGTQTLDRLEQPPRRVFLRVHVGALLPQAFQDGYVSSLQGEFAALGAEVRLAKLTGLELERTAYVEEQQAFEPDLILVVQFDATGGIGSTYRGEARLSLRDRAENELWRAAQRFTFTEMLSRAAVRDSGRHAGIEVIQRMLADRVLGNTQARAEPRGRSVFPGQRAGAGGAAPVGGAAGAEGAFLSGGSTFAVFTRPSA